MIKRLGCLLAMLICLASAAVAETMPEAAQSMLPPQAVLQPVQVLGEIELYAVSIPDTGEELTLTSMNSGEKLFLQTYRSAESAANGQEVARERAEELVKRDYPECRILFFKEDSDGKRIGVAADDFCGSIVVDADLIRSRELESGKIFQNGALTLDGALKILKLHRPDAEFRALELDDDDGFRAYEGEALVSGEIYEFKLDASTGKLLEWERD